MSQKAIYEFDGKEILKRNLKHSYFKVIPSLVVDKMVSETIFSEYHWLKNSKLVIKPDQMIKRRGKLGLVAVDIDYNGLIDYIKKNLNTQIDCFGIKGVLNRFIVEPFIQHDESEELYLSIFTQRNSDVLMFYHQGGVNVGDVDSKASKLTIPVNEKLNKTDIQNLLGNWKNICELTNFIMEIFDLFRNGHFSFMEINPLVVKNDSSGIYVVDLAVKLDETARYLCEKIWGSIEFPSPFGRTLFPEEHYIRDIDSKSGASLKLTVINPQARIWTMVAGGGASVIYSDTICELGDPKELANYGEYSGAPTESQTFEYAKTILKLMTDGSPRQDGKILIIGGGIANFTNVSSTFSGIVKALQNFREKLIEHKVVIFVRRGGPNYQEGLKLMYKVGLELTIPVHVYGTETHMTEIVGMALGFKPISKSLQVDSNHAASSFFKTQLVNTKVFNNSTSSPSPSVSNFKLDLSLSDKTFHDLFNEHTRAIIWGLQEKAIQGMLDFDYVCQRTAPSVAAIVYPFSCDHIVKFYYGHKEILIPVFPSVQAALEKLSDVSVLVNFASLRSASQVTQETLNFSQIKTIVIVAEGIPERLTQETNIMAQKKNVTIIGPATVGGLKPGCIKLGNSGGMLDNILASKLYQPGSVAYISRSGGMSNELNSIISQTTDGVYEGIAIGGDRFPGTTYIDHILRFEANPSIKMIVLLGEVGGTDEYEVINAIKKGHVKKPIVAWCIGTCSDLFGSSLQFGHANACAGNLLETSINKNKEFKAVGCIVPKSFDDFGQVIRETYQNLVNSDKLIPMPDIEPPTIPMDYQWAQELGLIRKPAAFISSVCDERGGEPRYAGVPVSVVLNDDFGIGGTLGLLWFQRRLSKKICQYIEMCLIVTADHGPAVSGAHNTMVTARAGKDLVSSLCSGLLTIGERFGGAVDGAAKQFSEAFFSGLSPQQFVESMRKKAILIQGIGHRVKSIHNPDRRVSILLNFIKDNFETFPLLKYALEVEKITTAKKPNLILNVDGMIGVSFVDLMIQSGNFTKEETLEYVNYGALNGLFVLGRTIGFVGHFLDQKRLRQGLYRHPWDDITYVLPDNLQSSYNFK